MDGFEPYLLLRTNRLRNRSVTRKAPLLEAFGERTMTAAASRLLARFAQGPHATPCELAVWTAGLPT